MESMNSSIDNRRDGNRNINETASACNRKLNPRLPASNTPLLDSRVKHENDGKRGAWNDGIGGRLVF